MLEPTTGRVVTRPSVGRIVHLRHPEDGACLAAIVTAVRDPVFDLAVFRPAAELGTFTPPGGVYTATEQLEDRDVTWHWPERVDG